MRFSYLFHIILFTSVIEAQLANLHPRDYYPYSYDTKGIYVRHTLDADSSSVYTRSPTGSLESTEIKEVPQLKTTSKGMKSTGSSKSVSSSSQDSGSQVSLKKKRKKRRSILRSGKAGIKKFFGPCFGDNCLKRQMQKVEDWTDKFSDKLWPMKGPENIVRVTSNTLRRKGDREKKEKEKEKAKERAKKELELANWTGFSRRR